MNNRLLRRLLIGCAVAGALVALRCHRQRQSPVALCEAARDASDGEIILVCGNAYRETRDPAAGIRLANSFRRSRQLDEASRLATTLLATSAYAQAVQVLGKVAVDRQDLARGRGLLSLARVLHVIERDAEQIARTDQALSSIYRTQERFPEALAALDSCITWSRAARATVVEGYCHLSAAVNLEIIGFFEGARHELELAKARFTHDRDRAQLELIRAHLEQHSGFGPEHLHHHKLAVTSLQRALYHATVTRQPAAVLSAELNLAYSLAELGESDAAAAHLETARLLDVEGSDTSDRAVIEARIAYRRGDTARATAINTATYDRLVENDTRLRVCVMQADIALAHNDLGLATLWARRGVEIVESLRARQAALELRAWALTLRRQPYEQLFVALARGGELADALSVVDSWLGRSLLDGRARALGVQRSALAAMALQSAELAQMFPILASAPVVPPLDRATAVAAVRDVDLVALVLASNDVWRITARHGDLAIVDLGPHAALRAQLDEFIARPTRPGVASALGAVLLGDDAFRTTREPLFVLLDGQLGNLPIAALRARGLPLIAMRPMVRASRLSELGCVPATPRPRHATILADARGDLRAAWHEAIELAARLRVLPAVAAAARSTVLFGAARTDLLHVAVHGSVKLGSGVLELHDRDVSALEIAVRGPGSALVVMSACASGAADDGEHGSSLATGFLASGSDQVLATLRPVSDPGAREVIDAFYRADGIADPVRALARVQAALSTTTNTDWPNFAVFGHDLCPKELP